jgi:energy-converting hydrogenase Eha subunit F
VSSNVKVAKFLNLIYDPDSKQRIYALLLAVGSAILALSIKFGSDLDTLFQSFNSFTLNRICLIIISVATILWGVL